MVMNSLYFAGAMGQMAPRVAVVDDFYPHDPKSHGRQVKSTILSHCPIATVDEYHCQRVNESKRSGYYQIAPQLANAVAATLKGVVYDVVNLSMGCMIPIDELKQKLKLPKDWPNGMGRDQEALEREKAKVVDQIRHRPQHEVLSSKEGDTVEEIVSAIDSLGALAKNASVFIAAGGGGTSMLNLYSLAPGVQTVGGLLPNGEKDPGSPDNPFVTQYALAVTPTIPYPGTSWATANTSGKAAQTETQILAVA